MPVGNPAPRAVQLDGLKLMWLPAWRFHNKALLSADECLRVGAAGGEAAQAGARPARDSGPRAPSAGTTFVGPHA